MDLSISGKTGIVGQIAGSGKLNRMIVPVFIETTLQRQFRKGSLTTGSGKEFQESTTSKSFCLTFNQSLRLNS